MFPGQAERLAASLAGDEDQPQADLDNQWNRNQPKITTADLGEAHQSCSTPVKREVARGGVYIEPPTFRFSGLGNTVQ